MRKNLILLIVAIFVAFVVAEFTLRLQNYAYVPLKIKLFRETTNHDQIEDGDVTDWRPFHETDGEWATYSPDLIWQPKKNSYGINAQGFQGKPIKGAKTLDEYRILVLGDSNSRGFESISGWAEYLGQFLEKKIKNVYVINGGVAGYSSWQGFKRFEELAKYEPDIVFIGFGANDAHLVAFSDREYVSSKRFYNVLHRFRLGQLAMQVTDIWTLKKHPKNLLVHRVGLSEYADNLNSMIDLAKKNKSQVILLTRPNSLDDDFTLDPLSWISFSTQFNELTRKVAKDRGVKLVDFYSYFKDKKAYFVDDSHFTDEGHQIAAQLIYNQVFENLSGK